MQETLITTGTVEDEEGRRHEFRYSLLTRRGRDLPVRYGVQVEEVGGDTARAACLTEQRERALLLLRALAELTVTPVDLPAVLEDWGLVPR